MTTGGGYEYTVTGSYEARYRYFDRWYYRGTWNDAQILCENMGASVVAINSEEESQVINTIVGYDTDIWIGYRAAASSSTWEWASGETSDFTVWRAGEPKAEARTVPRCAYLTTDDESRSYTTREWREADCNFTTMRKGWETPLLCEIGTDIAEWPTPGPTQKPTDAPTLKPSFTQMPTVTPVPTQSIESRRSHALCFDARDALIFHTETIRKCPRKRALRFPFLRILAKISLHVSTSTLRFCVFWLWAARLLSLRARNTGATKFDATHRAPSVVSTNVHNYTMGKKAPD